jgi:hypothetical protein
VSILAADADVRLERLIGDFRRFGPDAGVLSPRGCPNGGPSLNSRTFESGAIRHGI